MAAAVATKVVKEAAEVDIKAVAEVAAAVADIKVALQEVAEEASLAEVDVEAVAVTKLHWPCPSLKHTKS